MKLLSIQMAIALPFFLVLTQQGIIIDLIRGHVQEPLLIGTCADAFLRYAVGLVLSVFILSVLLYKVPTFALCFEGSILRLVLFSALLYFIVFSRLLQYPYGCDDVYIDYRYVKNFVAGYGITYNPGQKIMGLTSQLHFLILSFFAWVLQMRDISVLSQGINALLQVAIYLSIFWTGRQFFSNPWLSLLSCACFALSPYQIGESLFGKETSLLILTLLWSVWSMKVERFRLSALLSVLIVLIRPEGIVWLIGTFILSFRKLGNKWITCWLYPGVLLALWYILLNWACGSILPQGGLAKSVIYHGVPFGGAMIECLVFIGRLIVDTPWCFHDPLKYIFLLPDLNDPVLWIMIGFLVVSLLILYAWRESWLRMYAVCALIILVFYSLKNQPMFSWYFGWFSLVPIFIMPLLVKDLLGLAVKINLLLPRLALYIILIGLLLVPVCQQPRLDRKFPFPIFVWPSYQQRLLVYKEVGDYLNHTTTNRALIASPELGMLGYSLNGQILDLGGLVSPELLKYYPVPVAQRFPQSNYTIPVQAIIDIRPDYVVLMDIFAKNGLLKDPYFLSNYVLDSKWALDLWYGQNMSLYRLKSGSNKP